MYYDGTSFCIEYPTLSVLNCTITTTGLRIAIDSKSSEINSFAFLRPKESGGFSGAFEPESSILNPGYSSIYWRNLASVFVTQPLVCLTSTDGVYWDVDTEHFPVYL